MAKYPSEAFLHTRRLLVFGSMATLAAPVLGQTQTFPSRVIRIVVPYPAGGPTDALARIVAAEIQTDLGQSVIVENKAGGAGTIGTRAVAKGEADGHTIVLGTNQTHVINAFLIKDADYDPIKDFAPIAGLTDLQHVLVVRNDLPANSVQELIALAKKDPGKLNYGSTGIGSASHLAMELFKSRSGTDMQHIPYSGAAPMATEIAAGRIDLAMATLPSVLGQITGKTMRAIALASAQPAPQLPELALLKNQGLTDAEADAWLALFAPAATPAPARDRLSKAVLAAMAKPDVREKATKLGFAVNLRDPQNFSQYHAGEMSKWAEVVRLSGVQ